MNSKLIKASLAGAAALAVAAGGSTFASWSDFQTEDASAGAGFLRLNLTDRQGAGSGISPFSLAPGQNKMQEFYLASADSGNTPNGTLTAVIENLVDAEDGASGTCTTNSEEAAEGTSNCVDNGGELSSQARVQILASVPVASASSCPNTGIYSVALTSPGTTLAGIANTVLNLGTLNPNQGVCVRIEMSLPSLPGTANNLVQGDDVAWNWKFDLNQV